jgi:hypothetical protein
VTKEIDGPSLSGTAQLPTDASVYRILFDIRFYSLSSLFRRLGEVSIAFPASGDAALAFRLRFVAFYMSYPDTVRQRVLVSKRVLVKHVLASDAPGPDFWSADAVPSDGRSVCAVRLE